MAIAGVVRITKKLVDAADLARGRHWLWDSELKGFGVQVEVSGTRTYVVRYRPRDTGRAGPRRFVKLGRHGDLTAEQARSAAKAILGAVAQGEDPAARRQSNRDEHARLRQAPTFAELCDRFLQDHVGAKRKARTAVGYETLLRKHAVAALGAKKAEAITRSDVARLHLAMRATPHNANRLIAVIGSMYSFAAKAELVPAGLNPSRGIERYREDGRERYLSTEELRRLGRALDVGEREGLPWVLNLDQPKAKHIAKSAAEQRVSLDRHAAAAIRLLLLTGARVQEVLKLRWPEVDRERGLLLLPDSKTGRKTIVLSGAALAIIEELYVARTKASGLLPTGFVIEASRPGQARADLKRPWSAVRRHAGLDGVRLHDLRHTFASLGAGAGLGLPIVGKLLGHANPQTTARYAHLDADPLRLATDLIGSQISSALANETGF